MTYLELHIVNIVQRDSRVLSADVFNQLDFSGFIFKSNLAVYDQIIKKLELDGYVRRSGDSLVWAGWRRVTP